jgi:hypothetical protein
MFWRANEDCSSHPLAILLVKGEATFGRDLPRCCLGIKLRYCKTWCTRWSCDRLLIRSPMHILATLKRIRLAAGQLWDRLLSVVVFTKISLLSLSCWFDLFQVNRQESGRIRSAATIGASYTVNPRKDEMRVILEVLSCNRSS